jgi:mRNA interferase RelE/StbE
MPIWRVVVAPTAAEAIRVLPPDIKRSVRGALRAVALDPYLGKELLRELRGLRSHRARRYRVIYEVVAARRLIHIVAVGHRTTVYEELAQQRLK